MRNLIRRFFSAIADGIGSGISTMATTGKKKYLNLEGLTYLCSKIKDALTLKLDKSQIVQNATTAATDKVPSAAVVKNLQDQITQLNTNTTPRKYLLTLLNGFEGSAWCVVIGRFVLLHVSVTCPGNTGILAKLPDELVPATMQFDDLWLQSPGNPSDIGDDTIDLIGSITVWDASGSSAPGHVGLRTWGGGAIKQGYIARTSFVYYLD